MANPSDQDAGSAGVPPFGAADSRLATGGLSWSWDLDLSAVIEALTGQAPWLRTADGDHTAAADDAAADDAAADDAAADDAAADDAAADGPTDASPPTDHPPATNADEADEAAWQEAITAWRADEIPLDVVAGRVAESLPVGPGLAGWLAQARAAELEDGALAGVAASFRRLASWAAAGELAAVAQIASRSARTDRRAEVDQDGRPDRVTADASGQVALALAMSHDGATSWADLGIVLTWRLPATGAALAAGQIDLARARMIARMTSPLSETAARAVEAAVLDRAGWQTLGQLYAALRRAVIKADPEGAERRRQDAERNAKVVLYPEDEGTATLAGYSLPGVQAAAAMARIAALAKAMKAAGTSSGQLDLVRAQVFLGLLLGTLPYIPPAPGAPPDPDQQPDPPADDPPPADPSADDPPPPDDPLDGEPADRDPADGGPADADPADADPADGAPAPAERNLGGDQPCDPLTGASGRWPGVLPFLAPGPANLSRPQPLPGAAGLLNLTVPFATLAGISAAPAQLSRLGVITGGQARELADVAARHLDTRWRIIVTTASGEAIAVTHVPRSRGPGCSLGAAAGGTGLVGRVTLIVRADELGPDASGGLPDHGRAPPASSPLAVILARARSAAIRAAEQAAERGRLDARAGGCAHALVSEAYRPPPRIGELVRARDGTCRFPSCRRPAEGCDLDHTVPFDRGGLTCACNLGGQCRSHHQLKQDPRWTLRQPAPGIFQWTTPSGRTYIARPDPHLS